MLRTILEQANRLISASCILMIKAYRLLFSPVLGQNCRFSPSCSQYAIQAIQHHGVIRGSYLSSKRLLRCHPWCEGGIDPIPPVKPMCKKLIVDK